MLNRDLQLCAGRLHVVVEHWLVFGAFFVALEWLERLTSFLSAEDLL